MLYAIVVVLVLIADQLVKYWVTANITLNSGSVELIPGILKLVNIHNDGAAFSLFPGYRWIFVGLAAAVTIAVILALIFHWIKSGFGRWMAVLTMAGALGNAIDRAIYGYVVDMFVIEPVKFIQVFNVADIFITVGGILFCLYLIISGGRYQVKRVASPASEVPAPAPAEGPARSELLSEDAVDEAVPEEEPEEETESEEEAENDGAEVPEEASAVEEEPAIEEEPEAEEEEEVPAEEEEEETSEEYILSDNDAPEEEPEENMEDISEDDPDAVISEEEPEDDSAPEDEELDSEPEEEYLEEPTQMEMDLDPEPEAEAEEAAVMAEPEEIPAVEPEEEPEMEAAEPEPEEEEELSFSLEDILNEFR
jgi:signal peptidase II